MSRELADARALREGPQVDKPAPVAQRDRRTSGRFWLLGAALLLAGLFALGFVPRERNRARAGARAAQQAARLPIVNLVRPAQSEHARPLTLPASLQGLEEATVYARADGYVAALHADMGDEVQAGQVLADLDTPEIEREIQQAQASLASSEASLMRAQAAARHSAAELTRYQSITPGLISQQDLDERRTRSELDRAEVAVAEAARSALQANLGRLRQLKAFAKVVAPFAGTVTARSTERGALIVHGKDSPLFKIASSKTLRAFAQVPQSRVAAVTTGQHARVAVAEYPGLSFDGVVTRSASALDSATRTMTIEVQVQNPERKLLPGMFASVTLQLDPAAALLSVPATALIIDEHGTHVASVNAQGRVHLLPVTIERDHGDEVEIGSGLSAAESIIVSPGPSITEGSQVQVATR